LNTYLASYKITDICMSYLSFPCFDLSLDGSTIIQAVQRGDYAFQDYAISNWIAHVQALRVVPPHLNISLEAFFRSWRLVLASRYGSDSNVGENEQMSDEAVCEDLENVDMDCRSYNVEDASNNGKPEYLKHSRHSN